jgi:hypothetical protein
MSLRMKRLATSAPIALRKHEGGYAAEGPGYFIWDEDPKEVLRARRELARGNFELSPSTRFLVVRDDVDLAP